MGFATRCEPIERGEEQPCCVRPGDFPALAERAGGRNRHGQAGTSKEKELLRSKLHLISLHIASACPAGRGFKLTAAAAACSRHRLGRTPIGKKESSERGGCGKGHGLHVETEDRAECEAPSMGAISFLGASLPSHAHRTAAQIAARTAAWAALIHGL